MQQHSVLLLSSDEIEWPELRRTLRKTPEIDLVGEATTPRQAAELAAALTPDVIIAAATAARQPTLPLLVDLHRDCCRDSKIIIVASHYDPQERRTPMDTGVTGYLLWSDLSRPVLHHALAFLIAGNFIAGSRSVVERFSAALQQPPGCPADLPAVTAEEQAVLRGLALGLKHEQIATTTGLKLRKVERLLAKLAADLDAPTPFILGQKVAQLGLLDDERAAETRHSTGARPPQR